MPDVIILGIVAIVALLLYLREALLRQKLAQDDSSQALRAQHSAQALLDANRQRGYEILHQAIKKAQALMGTAELDSLKASVEGKHQADKVREQTVAALTATTTQTQQALVQAQQDFQSFLQQVRQDHDQSYKDSQEQLRQHINELFEHFEQKTADFLLQAEQQTTKSIELELKSARQLIESYKTQQLSLIDENIVAMLERTISLVLAKKLSLKDQMELVFEALEQAKAERFIV